MKELHTIFLAAAFLSLASCISFDPLQRVADEADRVGGRAARLHEGSNVLDSAFQIAETLYYSKKYPGSPEQIQKAITRGRLAVSRWRETAGAPGAKWEDTGVAARQRVKPVPPKFILVGIGKSESTGQTQAAMYETVSDQILQKKIIELYKDPAENAPVKVDGIVAQYVGKGS